MRAATKPLIALALFAAIGILLWMIPDVRAFVNPATVLQRLEQLARGPWGMPALFLLSAGAVLFAIPQLAVVSAAALLYPAWAAVLIPWLGCLAGGTASYYLSRFFFRETVMRLVQRGKAAALIDSVNRGGFGVIFGLRMAFFMFPALNWLPGAAGMPFGKYFAGTALGILPWLAVTTYVSKRAGGMQSAKELMELEVLLPVAGFVLAVGLLRLWLKKRTGGAKPAETETTPL